MRLYTYTHLHANGPKCKNSILLTGTIDTSKFGNTNVKLIDTNQRLNQYENAISNYIADSAFNNIIFVENSGYKFDYEKFNLLASKYNKNFEFIQVETDIEKTKNLGKSYGEAILIKEGIEKSKLLRNQKYIYKVTGRIFLKNSKQICKTRENNKSEFIVFNKSHWCNTMFFKVKKDDYEKVLKDAYLYCNEQKGKDIESVYYDLLIKSDIQVKSFSKYPDLTGIIGTTGEKYDREKWKMFIKNILIKFGFYTLNDKKWGI